MFAQRLITALLLTIAGASAAQADDACASLNPLLRTVDTAYEISLEPTQRGKLVYVSQLEDSLQGVSLLDLYGGMEADEVSVSQTAMILFIGELTMAMERYNSDEKEAALDVVGRGVPRLVRTELARLEKDLACRVSDSWTEEPQVRHSVTTPGTLGDAARTPDNLIRESETASRAWPQQQHRPHSSGAEADRSSGRRTQSLAALGFPLMLSLALLGGAAYWCRPRIRRWKKRAERHVCYRRVPVRLGADIRDLTIVDFNIGGLRMKHDGRITRKRSISFALGDTWLRGNVVWTNDCYAGIRLARPLTDDQISMLCFNTRRQTAEASASSGLAAA